MISEEDHAVTNKRLLEEIIKSREELKSTIEANEAKLLALIDSANNRITSLEEENNELKVKIEHLEAETRKNNILIFGLKRPVDKVSPNFICHQVNSLLDINLCENDINDVYVIGKEETGPIKVELCSYIKKVLIFKNCSKLKGTKVSVANDLTIKQREENKVLRKYLPSARQQANNKKCFIKNNKLIMGNMSYSAKEIEGKFQSSQKVDSAASTSSERSSVSCREYTDGHQGIEELISIPLGNKKKQNCEKGINVNEIAKKKLTKESAPLKALRSRREQYYSRPYLKL